MLKRLYWFRHKCEIDRMLDAGLKVGRNTLLFNEAKDFGCDLQSITIGNNCIVASGVRFITNPALIKHINPENREPQASITIYDNCFLGINSIIYPGVAIGPDAVVGAGAVVTGDVPPNRCVIGNPAHITCTVDIYRCMCKRSVIPDYTPGNKREILQKYFWGVG